MVATSVQLKLLVHETDSASTVALLMKMHHGMPFSKVLMLPDVCKVPNPEFEGQTKTRLGNPEVRKIVDGAVCAVGTSLHEHAVNAVVMSVPGCGPRCWRQTYT